MDYLKDLLEEMSKNPFKWTSAYSVLQDVINHNDKKALASAIREKPEILEYKAVRLLIADLTEGKKITSGGFTHKANATRNDEVLKWIAIYQAMGYPIKPSPHTEMTCCNLAGKKFHVSADTADKEIYRKRDKTEKCHIFSDLYTAAGRTMVRLNDGKRPDNTADLESLEQQFDEIQHDKDNARRGIFYEEQTKLMNEHLKRG